MKRILKDLKDIKNYGTIIVSIIAGLLLSYGYQVTHPTIGMDDTAVKTYFIDGLAPQVGRWTLFLLNKIFFVADFTPYFIDVLGLAFLGTAALLFCVLFKRITGNRIHFGSYIAFAILFVTSPFNEEVYIYYLHNGVGLAFLLTALSLLCIRDVIKGKMNQQLAFSVIFLAMAVGCYESFALVYILGICMMLFLEAWYGEDKRRKTSEYFKAIGLSLLPLIGAVILRTVISGVLPHSSGMEISQRSGSAMKYWFLNNPFILFKDLFFQFILRYIISGKYFFGAFAYASAAVLFVALIIWVCAKKKKVVAALSGIAALIAPWLLILVEIKVTPYRACQALMIFVGFVWMCLVNMVLDLDFKGKKDHFGETLRNILAGIVFAGVIVVAFRQGFQLNQYFYYESLKDRNDEKVCTAVANELFRNYDTSKPVAFVGTHSMPQMLLDWAYVGIDTEEYQKLGHTLNFFGRKGFYEYVNDYGYMIYEVGAEDLLNWMLWASLDGQKTEIYNYMYMLGYDFVVPSREQMAEAGRISSEMESWPQEGAVKDAGDFIVVSFRKNEI